MITQKQLYELNQLNRMFNRNEYYLSAISDDTGVRNKYNITGCIQAVELYAYLYKHYEMLADIFKSDKVGNMNEYLSYRILNKLLMDMKDRQASPAQAIKELKRIRSSVDYRGEWG